MTDDEFDAWLREALDCQLPEKPFVEEQPGFDYIDALRARAENAEARVAELESETVEAQVWAERQKTMKAEAERDKFERELLENGDWSSALARIRAERDEARDDAKRLHDEKMVYVEALATVGASSMEEFSRLVKHHEHCTHMDCSMRRALGDGGEG